jgi:hypothetical protein
VGARRYTRLFLKDGRTAVAVVYPESELEARARWLRVRDVLAPRIRVPEVFADDGRAVQLLEDFGDVSFARLWRQAPPAGRALLARQAARVAAAVAGTRDPGANPPFSAEFFQAELQKSVEAFFGAFARSPLSAGEEEAHTAFAKALCGEIGLVLALLGSTGAEGEFRKILSRRSGKLLRSVNEEAKC